MNTYLLVANSLTFLAFIIHTFVGDRELQMINPKGSDLKLKEVWTMARCGWHWISVDLLTASILLGLVNFSNYFETEVLVLQLLMVYFFAYAIVWLLTIFISKSFPQNYLKLGQWILLLGIAGLIFMGTP